jgi:hypothetical protein
MENNLIENFLPVLNTEDSAIVRDRMLESIIRAETESANALAENQKLRAAAIAEESRLTKLNIMVNLTKEEAIELLRTSPRTFQKITQTILKGYNLVGQGKKTNKSKSIYRRKDIEEVTTESGWKFGNI